MFPDEHSVWLPSRLSHGEIVAAIASGREKWVGPRVRVHNRIIAVTFVASTALALMVTRPAGAAATASDNACNSPYSGTNWSNGQNGGTGFGAWSLFQSGA